MNSLSQTYSSPHGLTFQSRNLVTFPSHNTHLLHPLDDGVYKPLKEGKRKEVAKVLTEHPGVKLDHYD
jgi:hypothetical protein